MVLVRIIFSSLLKTAEHYKQRHDESCILKRARLKSGHVSCCHLDAAAPAVAGAVVAEALGGGHAHDGEGVAPVHHARPVRVVLDAAPVLHRVLRSEVLLTMAPRL